MKNKSLLYVLLAILSFFWMISKVQAQECYELVWSDEFNYNGLPDSTKWTFEVGGSGWGNNELQYYTSKRLENARVVDSVLIIEARKESYEGSAYTSTRLNTYQTATWKYGKIDVRMKLPFGQGIWPAFWTLGNSIFEGTSWPACGEIDIMEMVGGGEGRDDKTYGTIHWADANNNHAQYGGSVQLSSGIFADDFHVFTIEWSETTITWFMDGVQYHIVDITPSHLSEFHENFFIILNLAVGGDWPGSPNTSTVFPQQLMVDYVRVYQKDTEPTIFGSTEVVTKQYGLNFETVQSDDFTYEWIVPTDAEIVSGQGTHKINVNWGCEAGIVSCNLQTTCSSYTLELPVTIKPIEILGKTMVAPSEENILYQVSQGMETSYNWEFPESVTSTTTLDSNKVWLNWGIQDGIVKVNVDNICGTENTELAVQVAKQLPYPDPETPHAIPGTIQSINYDSGGEGFAYHDLDSENQGTGSRQDEGVDIEANDGGENVGWIESGEWLEFSVNVEESKSYDVEIRVASLYDTGKMKILFNGSDKTGSISIPATGAWSSFSSIYVKDINLVNSDTLMRIEFESGQFNLGRMIWVDSILISINESNLSPISIFPSLTNQYVYVNECSQNAMFSIINSLGAVLMQGIIQNNCIDVSKLPEGMYVISIEEDKRTFSDKFVKANF
jgi:beta-glucanase (GH16 family)